MGELTLRPPGHARQVRLSTLGCGASELACSAVVGSVAEVWDQRGAVKGLTMVYEPSDPRFFRARFEPMG